MIAVRRMAKMWVGGKVSFYNKKYAMMIIWEFQNHSAV